MRSRSRLRRSGARRWRCLGRRPGPSATDRAKGLIFATLAGITLDTAEQRADDEKRYDNLHHAHVNVGDRSRVGALQLDAFHRRRRGRGSAEERGQGVLRDVGCRRHLVMKAGGRVLQRHAARRRSAAWHSNSGG